MSELISRFTALPPYGLGGVVVFLLYAVQSEVRFGSRARTHQAGASDRNSTLAVTLASAVSVLGFALGVKAHSFALPGLPLVGWAGVAIGVLGLGLRLWAVLTLRERYTRTLLVQSEHTIERSGPYRWVRHPGYLGSLFCLNGIALASGNSVTLIASLLATSAAYTYRIKVEDEMLVASLGADYAEYRRHVGALFPRRRA